MDGNKRVWIYCRVAHPDTESLEFQKQKLVNAAQERGFEIAGITAENASGLTIKRLGLEEVFSAADAGLMDTLLALNPDRITRNMSELWDCVLRLDKQGIELLTLNAGVVKLPTACLYARFATEQSMKGLPEA